MAKKKHTVVSLKNAIGALKKGDEKAVGFNVAIEALSGYKLEEITRNPKDKKLVKALKLDLDDCIKQVRTGGGIKSKRVNEVGNKMEQPVIDAINQSKSMLMAGKPETVSGKLKATGYPDILIYDQWGRPTYLEVKTYNTQSKASTLRSFYVSPSDEFKVTQDARHLLVAFEMIPPAGSNGYMPVKYELVDLAHLICSIKFEIQSDNKRLYNQSTIL